MTRAVALVYRVKSRNYENTTEARRRTHAMVEIMNDHFFPEAPELIEEVKTCPS